MANELMTAPPSYLAGLNGAEYDLIDDAISGGLSAGGQKHHRIGIKGQRWSLISPDKIITPVRSLELDVIIVGANQNLSKAWYSALYSGPEDAGKAPDCSSDNGEGPSSWVKTPVAASCAVCPHSAWGTGKKGVGKACSDRKRLAVILADNPTGPVYELSVPPASLKNLATQQAGLKGRGIRLFTVVFNLTFEDNSEFPKLVFTPKGFVNPAQAVAVKAALGNEDEIAACTGSRDTVKKAVAVPSFLQAPPPAYLAELAAPEPPVVVAPVEVAAPLAPVAEPPAEPEKRRRGRPPAADKPFTAGAAASVQFASGAVDPALDAALKGLFGA